MLNPHAPNAFSRERAIDLIDELQAAVNRLKKIKGAVEELSAPVTDS